MSLVSFEPEAAGICMSFFILVWFRFSFFVEGMVITGSAVAQLTMKKSPLGQRYSFYCGAVLFVRYVLKILVCF